MGFIYSSTIRPLLFRFDSEHIHDVLIRAMSVASHEPIRSVVATLCASDDQRLAVRLFGRVFSNPLGLAAGFDKNCRAFPLLGALGFGHVEVGTVTPEPQPGNPKPRIFRLQKDKALINRMGFPSGGAGVAERALRARKAGRYQGILGVNLGKNKDTPLEEAVNDYRAAFERLAPFADYATINVSSPNTPQLRDLQRREPLAQLIAGVQEINPKRIPLLVKVAPDLTWEELDEVLAACSDRDIEGIIATNTTSSRGGLQENLDEQGGLSGAPLAERSCEVVRYIYQKTNGELPIVGVGGVSSASGVLKLMSSGASLVQLYTGFVYEGPGLVRKVKRDLVRFIDKNGLRSITEIIGSNESPVI